jgi:hypothetical protein
MVEPERTMVEPERTMGNRDLTTTYCEPPVGGGWITGLFLAVLLLLDSATLFFLKKYAYEDVLE